MKHTFRSLAALLLALTFLLCGCQTVLSETGRPDPKTEPLPYTGPDPVCPYPTEPATLAPADEDALIGALDRIADRVREETPPC